MALRVAGEDSKSFRVISALFLSQLVLIIIRDRRLVDTLILVGIAVVELLYFVFGTPPPR